MAMPSTVTSYEHVVLDEKNVPIIAGTTMKVIELVVAKTAYGWSPEELYFQYPHLTMGQIHSALAYYWDHKEELDQDIQRREELVEQIKKQQGPSPFAARMKAKGLR